MVKAYREQYNRTFTTEKYQKFLSNLNAAYPNAIDFRVAETPVFIDKYFKEKVLQTCENIIDIIEQTNFFAITKNAVPNQLNVPNENSFSQFIAFDFGICENAEGEIEPQLIEMQGFPTLFAYQVLHNEIMQQHFSIPENYSAYFNGFTKETYLQLLHEIIVGDAHNENVVLLELFPHQQKTRIDFYCTQKYVGIAIVCLTELIKEGANLFYIKDGNKIQIKRIYNRIIFDELQQQSQDIQEKGKILFEELNVEWIPHPNWFYRISKYTLPFLEHPNIPETKFLSSMNSLPTDLNNYVVKPIFSFAGQGVLIDVTRENIAAIKDPENWIIQRKVNYAAVIETPSSPAKAEIRLFYFWDEGWNKPKAVMNLARLSKGKMIGTRYNKNLDWVGGTMAYFEQ